MLILKPGLIALLYIEFLFHNCARTIMDFPSLPKYYFLECHVTDDVKNDKALSVEVHSMKLMHSRISLHHSEKLSGGGITSHKII